KSQLAIEHCHRTALQSPEKWIFWAHASNTNRLDQSFREIAEQAKVRGRKDPKADLFKLVHGWLQNEKNGPWLLVIDNADDAAVLSPLPSGHQKLQADSGNILREHLSRYLPQSRHGSVLVTSRTKRAAKEIVEYNDIIPIEKMHDAAAYKLLYVKLGDKVDRNDGLVELAAALDHMPLALVQAAAYICERAPRCSVRQYLEEYYQSDSRKTSLLNHEAGHLRRDKAASNAVLITWQISFDYIRNERQSAADLLSLMSFFDRQGIHEDLLRSPSSTVNDDEFENDIAKLRDYSFITVTKDAKTFEMHNLIQLATRKWLENWNQVDKWRERFISHLCAEFPNGKFENWDKCQALLPHARAALSQKPKTKESLKEWALLLYKMAWHAYTRGRAGEVEHLSMISLEVRREFCGEENVETLVSMCMVGLAMGLGGQWKEAEFMDRQALALSEKVLGPDHPGTLTSMSNLALVLERQGKHEEAESMHRQALAQGEKVLGPDHPGTLATMNNLAVVLERQGKYEEAESMHRQALAQKEKVLGPKHPDTLATINNLAVVLERQGKHEEVESMHRQALALLEQVLGPEHPDTLATMNNLAVVLVRQGKYEEAESIIGRC
ncbi:hypothetical protein GQ44DRAFT_622318, partial [Phaeosphaeriaceae sp. PMI808]